MREWKGKLDLFFTGLLLVGHWLRYMKADYDYSIVSAHVKRNMNEENESRSVREDDSDSRKATRRPTHGRRSRIDGGVRGLDREA